MRLWEGDLDEKPVSHSGSAFSGVKRADAAEAARPRWENWGWCNTDINDVSTVLGCEQGLKWEALPLYLPQIWTQAREPPKQYRLFQLLVSGWPKNHFLLVSVILSPVLGIWDPNAFPHTPLPSVYLSEPEVLVEHCVCSCTVLNESQLQRPPPQNEWAEWDGPSALRPVPVHGSTTP